MINRIITLSGMAVFLSASAQAQIQNGNFESWEGNTPAGWSVIDSGVAVSPTSEQIKNGQLAAKVI
ncbi:MAG: endonuclease I, partial [Vibrio gallaecicus]